LRATTADELRQLASLLSADRKFDVAEEKARRAVQLDPLDAWGHCLLGSIILQSGDIASARAHVEKSLELSPYLPAALWNLALIDLHEEKWESGWERYEWGFARNFRGQKTLFPAWDGCEDLTGRKVWVWAEQGLGDVVQFSRYAMALKEKYPGAHIIFEVPESLVWILGHVADEVIASSGYHHPPHGWNPENDRHISVMSLPHRLKCAIPPPTPLKVNKLLFDQFKAKFKKYTVGIAWKGNPGHTFDWRRSIDNETIEQLVILCPGVQFVSLHKEGSPVDGILGIGEELVTWDETAALLCAVDEIVTVDTSIAHVSGCCKRPTSLLLSKAHDFRWGDRADSVWYPNFSVFRQETSGDWTPVFEQVAHGIRQRSRTAKNIGSGRKGSPGRGAKERQRRTGNRKAANLRAV